MHVFPCKYGIIGVGHALTQPACAVQEAQNRSAVEGGAAEAGQRAMAELSMNLSAEEAEATLLDASTIAPASSPTPPSPVRPLVAV